MKIVGPHGLARKLVGTDQPDDVDVRRLFDVPEEPQLGLAHSFPAQLRDAQPLADASRANVRRFGDGPQALLHLVDPYCG